jgi:hypothetical protein
MSILPTLSRALLPCAVALGLLAGPAQASVTIKGTGEPPYTNSANNTQWVQWSNNGPYSVDFTHYVDNVQVATEGPFQMPQTGSTWVNWSGIPGTSIPLKEGSTYAVCAQGRFDDGSGMYFPDGPNSCSDGAMTGRRPYTTIDRTKPTVAMKLAAGADVTKAALLPVHMDFADNIAGPFPANFLCVQYGDTAGGICDSAQGYTYALQPACSQPGAAGPATTFDCTIDVGAASANPAPDGPVSICAIAADAAIPDNPNSDDQRGNATQANLSAASCDTVLLDRTAPDLSIAVKPGVTVNAGDEVAFDAAAADALSGLKGGYTWTFGDGGKASTRATSHVYTAAGTYTVSVKTTDAAGNQRTTTKKITVSPPGTPVPPPVVAPPTNTFTATAPAQVTVPATGTGTINVAMNPSAAGAVALTLSRGTTQIAVGGTPVPAGRSTYALKLPAKAIAGAHTLKVVYTPTGRTAITKKLAVTLVGAAPALAASTRAASADPELTGGARKVLPDGEYHGPDATTVALSPTK